MKDGVLLRQVINVIDELDLSDYEESHGIDEAAAALGGKQDNLFTGEIVGFK